MTSATAKSNTAMNVKCSQLDEWPLFDGVRITNYFYIRIKEVGH